MSEHKIDLRWDRESDNFNYDTYNREHVVTFKNNHKISVSASIQYLGKPEFVDPEELFVASYASCHMLTFLAIAAKKKLVVDSYEDRAVGYLEKTSDGKLAVTRIELFPRVVFENASLSLNELLMIHQKAHENCFIANSTKVLAEVKPII